MSDRPDPAAIARGLSKAQREAVLWLPDDGTTSNVNVARFGERRAPQFRVLDRLVSDGLAHTPSVSSALYGLTLLGQQVRAVLESADAGA
ncbi:hypothetical protein [Pseudoroseomonas cervicalis]|uniref:hypothetical protein n=1 Tax=Teichococcus cervicalis TaxID=204525 RepID=UPI0027869A66|nr:hypothetical protein [Pseudoroseomonas cervicalis]MDQ1077970.1 shikimate kinase [Pseudoroseomonas cervicalis]